jgi:adenosylcobinamide-phosphate synthase
LPKGRFTVFEIICAVLLAIALDRYTPELLRIDAAGWCRRWADTVAQRSSGASRSQGLLALALVVLPPVLLVLLIRFVLGELAWILRFAFDVIVLSWTLDLHRLLDRAETAADALKAGDVPVANENLRLLSGADAPAVSETGIARASVEAVLMQGYAAVMAPLFWFILLGPVFAVLQRLATLVDERWRLAGEDATELTWASTRLNEIIGWLPARITAFSYAVMGSFEDALRCWRCQLKTSLGDSAAALLAAGLAALQLLMCEDPPQTGGQDRGVAITQGVAEADHVHRAAALLARALLFWLGVGVLMLLAGRLG